MKNLIPYVGDTKARERIEELFDRKSTTGFLLGAMIGGHVTTTIAAVAPGGLPVFGIETAVRLGCWTLGIVLTILLAVYWERVADVADDVADNVVDEATGADES